jgi:hypothetical protein
MIAKDVCLVGFCWGNFWEKFGEQWITNLEQLETKPERIILFTDRHVDLPFGWGQQITEHRTIWDFCNYEIVKCETKYVAGLMMDDKMPVDGLSDLALGADVVVSGHLDTLGNVNIPTRERYENCLDEPWYPLSGYHVWKCDLFVEIPLRPVDWCDWINMFEWFQHGIDLHFDGKVRQLYAIRDGQYSQPKNPKQARANINLMRDMVRNGGVKPGSVWPPEPL